MSVTAYQSVLNPIEASRDTEVPLWYVVHTRSRHEKTAVQELTRRGVETYLPLYETARQWKNGRHLIQMPLFPGYAFVCVALGKRLDVLRTPSVVNFVEFGGRPAPLEESEITSLRRALSLGRCAEPHPFIEVGQKIRITAGPLSGLEGIVVRLKGKAQVVVSLALIRRSVLVEVDSMELARQI